MDTIAGLPFAKLVFANDGSLVEAQQLADLLARIRAAKPARLAVVSHGWRNDAADATALYEELFTNIAATLAARGAQAPSVVGVYWTSMALPEEFGGGAPQGAKPEGAAVRLAAGQRLDPQRIGERLDRLKATFGGAAQLDLAKSLLDNLEDRPKDQVAFVELLRQAAPPTSDPQEDKSDKFFGADARVVFDNLSRPILAAAPRGDGDGGAAGLREAAAGLGDSLANSAQGALAAAFRLVNYLTFYQMKERAGVIGEGLSRALAQARAEFATLPIHLIGHSFGARVVTAAAAAGAKLDPCSLSLLQGAYSHNGLAAASQWDGGQDGYFRAILTQSRVRGPIIATHTANDRAVGVAYPIASRLAGQNAKALGDANDPYGGVGRNGLLHTLPAERGPDGPLQGPRGDYRFANGKINNLLADAFVKDHGDVRNPAVANAVAQVIESL
jgi:hypothetical protein